MVHIGSLPVDPPVVLAPMAGVTNAPFRRMCRRYGAGLYVSEMIGARGLVEGNAKTLAMAEFSPDEDPRSIQLYGTDHGAIGEAVAMLVRDRAVDHIDLNFGCPMPKVTRHGGGAALPWKLDHFQAIVTAAVDNAGEVPVTVKTRMGLDDDHLTFEDAGLIARDAGVAAVALHARTAHQLYSGTARWEAIGRLVELLDPLPVLGNGDIWTADDAVEMMARTGCAGVVVGRGCLGRPWLFGDLAAVFSGQEPNQPPTLGEIGEMMHTHARLLVEHFGMPYGINLFRRHPSWYLKGFPVGPEIRDRLSRVSDIDELAELVAKFEPEVPFPVEANRMVRGHSSGPRPAKVPQGWYDTRTVSALDARAEAVVSGG
ncbi:MAG: tRNA dihydrouridine synthase DusB [Acidimicrobiia bacterium]|nr:tRNA dihydrouridine synthase DusB [Acidimicrobiia bacterium]